MKSKIFNTLSILLGIVMILGLAGCAQPGSQTGDETMDLSEFMGGKFKPSELNMEAVDNYEFPYLGLSFKLPDELMKKMKNQTVAMNGDEMTDEKYAVQYGYMLWAYMTEEQKNAEVDMQGTGYFDWFDSLKRIGTLGMYSPDITTEELTKLTMCDQHTEIGTSSDGKFKYYLSKNSAADPEDTKLLDEIEISYLKLVPLPENWSVFLPIQEKSGGEEIRNIADIAAETIDGAPFTAADFAKHDLTMVNVLATWCTACIQEIPDIEKMYQEIKDKGLNVVGIVLDTVSEVDSDGKVVEDQSMIELTKKIQKASGASYSFLKPDASLLNGRLKDSYALPETFFVDKDGNIVGETYTGSHTYEEWMKIAQELLESVQGK